MILLLDLPGEIRNRIYSFLYQPCAVRVIVASDWGEHLFLPGSTPSQIPKLDERPRHRRRCRRRRLSCCPVAPFSTALLVTCSKLSAEAVPLLYASITFHFNSMRVINLFLDQASPEGIKSISKFALFHAAYGEPAKQENCIWKAKYDKRWVETCKRIAEEVVALEHLKLCLEISDWPTQLNFAAKWARPLLVLRGQGLDRVDVILKHSRFLKQRLLSAARMIEQVMKKEEGAYKETAGSRPRGDEEKAERAGQ